MALGVAGAARAQDAAKEALVKAAFLYNFAKFVEWPGEMAVSKRSRAEVCGLGAGAFGAQAASVLKAASTDALSVSYADIATAAEAPGRCHILYIGPGEAGKLKEINQALKGAPVLTVSEIDGFAEKQGMVGFILTENKVKLAVNIPEINKNGLRANAQLLEIASKVVK